MLETDEVCSVTPVNGVDDLPEVFSHDFKGSHHNVVAMREQCFIEGKPAFKAGLK
jgi:hypothetical protein